MKKPQTMPMTIQMIMIMPVIMAMLTITLITMNRTTIQIMIKIMLVTITTTTIIILIQMISHITYLCHTFNRNRNRNKFRLMQMAILQPILAVLVLQLVFNILLSMTLERNINTLLQLVILYHIIEILAQTCMMFTQTPSLIIFISLLSTYFHIILHIYFNIQLIYYKITVCLIN